MAENGEINGELVSLGMAKAKTNAREKQSRVNKQTHKFEGPIGMIQ